MKLPEPEGPALAKGNATHKLAEHYVTGASGPKLPPELSTFAVEFKDLRKHKAECAVEQQWALTRDWRPTEWFAKDAWLRVIVDVARWRGAEADVIDHKTGRVYPYHEEQLSLCAVATFAMAPDVQTVHTKLWYLEPGEEVVQTYTLKDVPRLKKEWEKAVAPMFKETQFKPNPSATRCKYCHFRKANNGPCDY